MYNSDNRIDKNIRKNYDKLFKIAGDKVGLNKLTYKTYLGLSENDTRRKKVDKYIEEQLETIENEEFSDTVDEINDNVDKKDEIKDKESFFKLGETIYKENKKETTNSSVKVPVNTKKGFLDKLKERFSKEKVISGLEKGGKVALKGAKSGLNFFAKGIRSVVFTVDFIFIAAMVAGLVFGVAPAFNLLRIGLLPSGLTATYYAIKFAAKKIYKFVKNDFKFSNNKEVEELEEEVKEELEKDKNLENELKEELNNSLEEKENETPDLSNEEVNENEIPLPTAEENKENVEDEIPLPNIDDEKIKSEEVESGLETTPEEFDTNVWEEVKEQKDIELPAPSKNETPAIKERRNEIDRLNLRLKKLKSNLEFVENDIVSIRKHSGQSHQYLYNNTHDATYVERYKQRSELKQMIKECEATIEICSKSLLNEIQLKEKFDGMHSASDLAAMQEMINNLQENRSIVDAANQQFDEYEGRLTK